MYNHEKMNELIQLYKKDFPTNWPNEKYKWEAVLWFQSNWNVNAHDFASMLKESLSRTINLLQSRRNLPAKIIVDLAQKYPEEVRGMFIHLYDETQDIVERILKFKQEANRLSENSIEGQHFQTENAISTYLWLKYPDKYYIYKHGIINDVSTALNVELSFKKGDYSDNIRNFLDLYNDLSQQLKQDRELKDLLTSHLDSKCYHDPECKSLTIDFGYYISRYHMKKVNVIAEWFPSDYTPDISIEEWIDLLNNKSIFNTQSLEIMKRMTHFGGQATCKQLSSKYGGSINFYNKGSSTLAERIAKHTGCAVIERDNENLRWWPILYLGRNISKDNKLGTFEWKLREELVLALEQVNLEHISLYVDPSTAIWKISHGTESTGISNTYKKRFLERNIIVVHGTTKAKGGSLVTQGESFMYSMKKGDYFYLCFGNEVKLLGRVTSDSIIENSEMTNQWYERPYEIIKESVSDKPYTGEEKWWTPNHNSTCIKVDDLEAFEELILKPYFEMEISTLFKSHGLEIIYEKYSKQDFLDEVFMSEKRYEMLTTVLSNKLNIILQGAPGVGKTFTAKKLAYSIMGEKDESRIKLIQFHQNYSYEDFILGYKPFEDGFELKRGVFYQFCQEAMNQPDKEHFFIIDEINRGNLSKIFGELLMLVEKDYRGTELILVYNGLPFSVPENVYIIGMMNTADRSLAMIDYALRRRFSFFELEPGFTSEGFLKYQNALDNQLFDKLILTIRELNEHIANDRSLGKGFCIGHSYFLGQKVCSEEWLHSVVEYDLIPMLTEYWFDNPNELKRWENALRGIFQ
jgi:5-methylcytosine-specific restriction enzyme B